MTRKRFRQISSLRISLALGGVSRSVGKLAWGAAQRRALFEYDAAFLADPLALSPFKLPAKPDLQPAPHAPFEGLHGLFNDSLPDGWGRKLLDRSVARQDIDFSTLTPLDRLAFVGSRGMGALCYCPEFDGDAATGEARDLDWFAERSDLVMADVATSDIDVLRRAQGGSGGARAKINIAIGPNESVLPDYGGPLPPGHDRWIVKFRGTDDPKEIGCKEFEPDTFGTPRKPDPVTGRASLKTGGTPMSQSWKGR